MDSGVNGGHRFISIQEGDGVRVGVYSGNFLKPFSFSCS